MTVKAQRKTNAAPVSYKGRPPRKARNSASKTTSKSNGQYPLAAYEHLHVGIVECSLEGKYTDANGEFCRILGYSKEELLQLGAKECTYEEDYALDLNLHEQLVAGKIPFYGIEKRLVRKDGQVIWVELTRSLVRDAKGRPLCTMGVVIDISEYKQVERVLRESAENLRIATEAARMFKWELNFQKQLYTFSDNFMQVLGFSAGLLPQNSAEAVWRLSPAEDVQAISTAITEAIESHEDLNSLQYRMIDPQSGQTVWLEANAKIVYDDHGNPQRMFGVAQNITESKRTEEKLRQQAEILDLAHVAIRDLDDHIISWSKGIERLYGWTKEEALGQISHELFQTKLPVSLEDMQEKLFTNGEWEGELEHVRRDGTRLTVLSRQVLQYDADGNPTAILENNIDITERKQIEQKLAHEQELLERFFETMPVMVSIYDPETNSSQLNRQFEQIVGWKNGELSVESLVQALYPDPEYLKQVVQRMAAAAPSEWVDVKVQARDGRRLDTLWANVSIPNGRQIGMGIDITERKQTERVLAEFARQQQALYQLSDRLHHTNSLEDVYNAALDAILRGLQCDRASILLFDETGLMRFVAWHGLSDPYRKATEGHSPWGPGEKHPYPVCIRDIPTCDLSDSLKAAIREEGIASLAFIPLILNGKLIGKFMVYFNAAHDCNDNEIELGLMIARQLAVGIDRKRAEMQLRESEQRYRTIVDTANEGIWYIDLTATTVYLNGPMARILDYAPEEIVGRKVPEFCFEEDIPKVQTRIASNYQGNYENFDFRFRRRDGSVVLVLASTSPVRGADGKIIGALGMFVDVTERKHIEAALQREQELLNRIFESIPIMLTVYDPSTNLLRLNKQFEQLVGWGSEDAAGVSLMEVCYPDPNYRERVGQFMEHGAENEWMDIQMRTRAGRTLETSWSNIHLSNEIRVGIGIDITERKYMEEQLRMRQAEMADIINQTPFMLTRCTRDLHYRFVSRAYAQMIGRTPEEVEGKPIVEIMGKEGMKTISPYIEKVLEGNLVEYESEVPFQGIVTPFLHVIYTPDRDQEGNVVGWFASIVDISERKQAEEKLRASEALYRTIARSIPGGGVYVVNKDFRYLVAEGPVTEAFGLAREQIEGKTVWEAFPDERGKRMRERLQQTIEGETVNFETEYNGRVYWTQQAPLRDSLGQAIIVTIDVTERKRAEEALRQSEERFVRFMQNLPGLAWIKDVQGRYVYANAAAEKAFNTPRQELYGRTDLEVFPSRVAEQFRKNDEQALANEKGMQIVETLPQDDGVVRYSLVTKFPIPGMDGNIAWIGGTAFDITERLQAEEALRKSEERYRGLFNLVPIAVYTCDAKGLIQEYNQRAAELWGRAPQLNDPQEKYCGAFKLYDSNGQFVPHDQTPMSRVLAGEPLDRSEVEIVVERPDGSRRNVIAHPLTLRDENGQIVEAINCLYDITEHKRIEDALRIENERFMRFVDSNIVGILIGDISGKVILANDYYLRLLGVSRQDFIDGNVDWKKFTPPEWLSADEMAIQQLRERGVCEPYEKEYVRRDGTRVPVYIADAMLPGPREEIAAFVLDITGRKQAEEALRESEGRLGALLRQATAGIVRKDAEGHLIFVNEAYCNMLGYPESELLGKSFWQFTYHEDVEENRRLYDRLMAEGIPFKLEKRVVRRDGSILYIDASVSPVMDAEGRPQSAVAVEVDITARKQAEEALQQLNSQLESRVQKRTATIQAINQSLREEIAERKRVEEALRMSEATARASEEKLRTLFDLLPVGISFLDPKGRVIQTNSALLNILRLSREQLFSEVYKSRKYIRADGTAMLPTEFASVRALAEARTIYNVETGMTLENGEVIWTSVSAAPVDVEEIGVVVVTIDVTDSKRAEQALQESHRRLRALSQRLVEVQEEERRALARELHDRVGQTLAALNINLIIINSQLSADLAQQIGARLNDSMKLVAETIALVRDVMTDLRPAVLDDYGLEAALEAHISGYGSRYNIQVTFEKPARPLPRLGPSVEMTFLRIAQEALMNIAKHAHAQHVNVSLREEAAMLCLTIRDDGIGIESWQDANRPGSHGLTIMRERAEAFGGTLKVKSVPNQGTLVEVNIPFTNKKSESQEKARKEQN